MSEIIGSLPEIGYMSILFPHTWEKIKGKNSSKIEVLELHSLDNCEVSNVAVNCHFNNKLLGSTVRKEPFLSVFHKMQCLNLSKYY